jgi:hypothetical protein
MVSLIKTSGVSGRLANRTDRAAEKIQPPCTSFFSRRWRVAQNGTAKMEARKKTSQSETVIYIRWKE